ncbi:ABC-three component system middle component 1 [Paraclostridium sordellii]|uniref:ABC-three component system middle component 1 n=1 Tax=Paraclostridium sordellii TaxID=1505 RepID=UPI0005DEE66E|nr:ABC-three component system middle component 1 [Paeniclostridium sordellii]CEN78417.1 Uncharacterised protein [[Clostridium] sordellii] [Paeniclostridium sordellii]
MYYNDMPKIIDSILSENNFTISQNIEVTSNIVKNIRFYEQQERDVVTQYLVTLNIDKKDLICSNKIKKFLKTEQKKIKEKLKDIINNDTFETNISLLIYTQYDENLNQYEMEIKEIEENLDFFNKFILLYNEQEINELNKILNKENCSICEFINNKFEEYKINKENYITKFINRIYIKMPFALIKLDILDIIDNILTENKFCRLEKVEEKSNINKEQGKLYIQKSKDSVTQYLLVLNINKEDLMNAKEFLEKNQINIYQRLKNHTNNSTFDKNISLLLCIEYNEGEKFEEINQHIMKIEEDPYCFKKFVLFYTKNELIEINNELNKQECCIWKFIKEKFEGNKVIDIEKNIIKFITKLCIKMPYIPIEFNNSHKFNNIEDKVNQRIEEQNLQYIWNNINNYELGSLKNLDLSIRNEKLDEILNNWYVAKGE